jgi:hypothetical protein
MARLDQLVKARLQEAVEGLILVLPAKRDQLLQAVAFLTSHLEAIESLQALLNHSRADTTRFTLRALNRSKAMEAVRNLSWSSSRFEANREEAHTGFEPVPPP